MIRNFFVLSHYIWEEIIIDLQFISSLLKGNTKYILVFCRCRNIIRIDLDHIVITFLFLCKNLQCFRFISRCDHSIRHFSLDQSCRINIADIRKRNKITEWRHTVCASCTCISTCKRRKFSKIIYPVNFCKSFIQWQSDCSTCRWHMLKGSCCRKSGCFF